MNKSYDIIIIGGGHNGLVAAALLAKRNRKVLLIEKRDRLGGTATGDEFHPGYFTTGLLHDTSRINKKVIEELELEKFGLKVKPGRATIGLLSKKGDCLQLSDDEEKTAIAISAFSAKDADAYRDYISFIASIRPFIKSLLEDFPPDLTAFGIEQVWPLLKKAWALRRLGKKTMLELLKVAPMSVADFLNEKFETEFIKAGIAAPALYGSFTGPWSSYTTLNLLVHECTASLQVAGGPQALIAALEKAARHHGAEILTNTTVDKIVLDASHKVSGVKTIQGELFSARLVISTCTPQITFFELLKPNQLTYTLEQSVRHYRARGTTAKVNLALNKEVSFNGISALEYYRTGNSFDEMERAFDPAKYGRFSEEPVLDIHVPTVSYSHLAPSGHSVVSVLVHYAPYHLKEGWNESTRKKLLDTVIQTLERYSPQLSSSIVSAQVLTPADLEAQYALTNGHIFHGEHAVDQLITRPFPSCAGYATPIEGLFICGSGSHPGGGITGLPGYLGALTVLKNRLT